MAEGTSAHSLEHVQKSQQLYGPSPRGRDEMGRGNPSCLSRKHPHLEKHPEGASLKKWNELPEENHGSERRCWRPPHLVPWPCNTMSGSWPAHPQVEPQLTSPERQHLYLLHSYIWMVNQETPDPQPKIERSENRSTKKSN